MDERTDRPGEAFEEAPSRPLGGQIRLWGGLGAGALLVIFLLQNLQRVEVNFLWMSYDIRMVYALLATAALGAFTAVSVGFLRGRARASRLRREATAGPKK